MTLKKLVMLKEMDKDLNSVVIAVKLQVSGAGLFVQDPRELDNRMPTTGASEMLQGTASRPAFSRAGVIAERPLSSCDWTPVPPLS